MALLVRAKAIVTCDTDAPQNGITFNQLGVIENGFMFCENEEITEVGSWEAPPGSLNMRRDPGGASQLTTLEFPHCIIVPGFIDAHTHPLFAGDRSDDFVARSEGRAPSQGMLHTVRETRKALEDPGAFWEAVANRLRLMLAHGTTTAEVKTGYALTKTGELQLLDLIDAHKDQPDLPRVVATFLGAHAVPPEFAGETAYIDYLIAEVLPETKAHGAVYADAFCEPGFFSPKETLRYLEAAWKNDLRLRVHCDEMAYSGAACMAAAARVDAVDHCNYIHDLDIEAIARQEIVTVACPATITYLDLPERTPVRKILERGGNVALASDYNPGTSPCFNLQTVAYFGRKLFGLSAAEALYGVTVAAARSVRAAAGTIRAGGPADFVVLRIDSPDEFGWQFGGNLAAAVFRAGGRVA